MPASCSSPHIHFWLRIGSAAFSLPAVTKYLPSPATLAVTRSLFRPILSWSSHISRLSHQSGKLIAEIPIGFKDGYPMSFLPHVPLPHVEISGEKFPIMALPTEHKLLVDVTSQEGEWMRVGQRVWLLGEKVALRDWFAGILEPRAMYDVISCIAMGGSSFLDWINPSHCHNFVAI
eukprot:TRINITY_DN7989_c0_g1_i3.p1 TRINITY_DN7989_c0_g1~~TRINITY_DN7989_c0_g1_i3.p1  ORF type:complete len:176 (-),score=11.34 TRINITY_DN7989_c0_g1_i3:14-541(-)